MQKYLKLFFCLILIQAMLFSCKPTLDKETVSDLDVLNLESEVPNLEPTPLNPEDFPTYKEYVEAQFDNIAWVDGDSLLLPEVSMPYNLLQTDYNIAHLYSQANDSRLVYSEFEGIGELNYVGIPSDILLICRAFTNLIKQKKINDSNVSPTRPFLQYFFPVVLQDVPEIIEVFFGRPEPAGDTFSVQFRLQFTSEENRISYAIASATFKYELEAWKLFEFELGGVQYENLE